MTPIANCLTRRKIYHLSIFKILTFQYNFYERENRSKKTKKGSLWILKASFELKTVKTKKEKPFDPSKLQANVLLKSNVPICEIGPRLPITGHVF